MAMSDGERPTRTSLIGVRAHWTCCKCQGTAITHQLVDAADPSLDLPPGWRQRKGNTFCPADSSPAATDLILKERTQ